MLSKPTHTPSHENELHFLMQCTIDLLYHMYVFPRDSAQGTGNKLIFWARAEKSRTRRYKSTMGQHEV